MKALLITMLAATALTVHAQDATQPPETAKLAITTTGIGLQIYTCTAEGKWTLQEPKADLFDPQTKQPVGKHSKGPTWTWNDGSRITGKVLQQRPSPGTIPWLLLEAQSTGTPGDLSNIAYVRRSETQAGLPQPENICGVQNVGSTLSIPYQATYTFYTAK